MTYFPSKMRPRPAVDGADAHEVRDFDPPDASVDFKPRGMGEVITIKEAVDRIAFQTCHLSSQDHVSQPAEELIRRAVLQSVRMRGTAKGAQQLSHFYATVITSLAEKLNESELLCDTWFNKWKDDVAR